MASPNIKFSKCILWKLSEITKPSDWPSVDRVRVDNTDLWNPPQTVDMRKKTKISQLRSKNSPLFGLVIMPMKAYYADEWLIKIKNPSAVPKPTLCQQYSIV